MNLSQAYKILELKDGATEAEINKQFRKLAAKFHPDVNKSPEAEQKSKEISQAYSILKDPSKATQENFKNYTGHANMDDFMDFMNQVIKNGNYQNYSNWNADNASNFKSQYYPPPFYKKSNIKNPIRLETTLSFSESILGIQQKFSIERFVRCDPCLGKGFSRSEAECIACYGQGKQVHHRTQGYTQFKVESICPTCEGLGKQKIPCEVCHATGEQKTFSEIEIRIPAGVKEDDALRLKHMGHYNGFNYDDASLLIHVTPEENMRLSGADVISTIEISLLESLNGVEKKVRTIHGEKDLKIEPHVKNKDEVIMPGYGVNGTGNHIFILDVKWPDDDKIKKLTKYLKKLEKEK